MKVVLSHAHAEKNTPVMVGRENTRFRRHGVVQPAEGTREFLVGRVADAAVKAWEFVVGRVKRDGGWDTPW